MDGESKNGCLKSLFYISLLVLALVLITYIFGFLGFIVATFGTVSVTVLVIGVIGIVKNQKTNYQRNCFSNNVPESKTTVPADNPTPLTSENILKNDAYMSGNLHMEKYYPQDRAAIERFLMKYDLSDADAILQIPVPKYKRQQLPTNVPTEPEQILQRQATYYKKTKKMDLALACLKKSNEFMKTSFYSYRVKDYMRLVDFMYLNSQFDEARSERQKIYKYLGKDEVGELTELMNELPTARERDEYYRRLIIPEKEKMRDKEEFWLILENLPELAPKSFSGYRKMKRENTDNFTILKLLAEDMDFKISGV